MSKQTKRQKGRAYEIWVRDWLIERGWIVRDFPPTSKIVRIRDKKTGKLKAIPVSSSQDCLGADLLCVKSRSNHDEILLIQCSLDASVKKRVEEYQKYFSEKITNLDLQLWIKREKLTDIKRCLPSGEVRDLGKIIRRQFYALEDGYGY